MEATSRWTAYAEVERRVRAWIAGAALNHDAGAALTGCVSGLCSGAEMSAIGPEVSREVDVLMAFAALEKWADLKAEAARAAPGAAPSPILDAIATTAASDLGVDLAATTPQVALFRRVLYRNLYDLFDAADASAAGPPVPEDLLARIV